MLEKVDIDEMARYYALSGYVLSVSLVSITDIGR
jgi:hypothetical protein